SKYRKVKRIRSILIYYICKASFLEAFFSILKHKHLAFFLHSPAFVHSFVSQKLIHSSGAKHKHNACF
ncbi:MAG: hypothetical protein RSF68_12010, partial [Myroides sp.]